MNRDEGEMVERDKYWGIGELKEVIIRSENEKENK